MLQDKNSEVSHDFQIFLPHRGDKHVAPMGVKFGVDFNQLRLFNPIGEGVRAWAPKLGFPSDNYASPCIVFCSSSFCASSGDAMVPIQDGFVELLSRRCRHSTYLIRFRGGERSLQRGMPVCREELRGQTQRLILRMLSGYTFRRHHHQPCARLSLIAIVYVYRYCLLACNYGRRFGLETLR